MSLPKKRRRHILTERQALIADYMKSPLTATEYVVSKGIGLSTFARWHTKAGLSLKKPQGPPQTLDRSHLSFVSLKKEDLFMDLGHYFPASKNPSSSPCEKVSMDISIPSGIVIKLCVTTKEQATDFIKGLL